MLGELTRGKVMVALAVGAVAFGAAAGLLFGPVWTIVGVLVGSLVGAIVLTILYAVANPDAANLLNNDQPDEAIAQLHHEMSSWRTLARIWPSQFRDALASRLIVQAGALQAVNRDEEALRHADEAVAIYQDLAAERPASTGRTWPTRLTASRACWRPMTAWPRPWPPCRWRCAYTATWPPPNPRSTCRFSLSA